MAQDYVVQMAGQVWCSGKTMEFFYIFNVPSGHRFHVEVSLHWKVRELQECIVQVTGINVDDQQKPCQRPYMFQRFPFLVFKVHHQKPKATDLLQNFDEVIDQLKRIRLPGTLLAHSRGNVEPSSFSDTSLYAWISASDPEHSLKELVDQVSEQFGNFEQMDAKMVVQNIEKVMDLSRNVNCREIKGINIRLSYLDHHLQNAEDRGKTIEKHASKILDTPSRIDQSSLEELVSQYRYLMRQIYTELKEIRLICNRFFQSKLEFLRILRIRLNSWIVR
ncbi:hypothetical protein OSTOST_08239, partial [Ostertagia ostertagi]